MIVEENEIRIYVSTTYRDKVRLLITVHHHRRFSSQSYLFLIIKIITKIRQKVNYKREYSKRWDLDCMMKINHSSWKWWLISKYQKENFNKKCKLKSYFYCKKKTTWKMDCITKFYLWTKVFFKFMKTFSLLVYRKRFMYHIIIIG